MDSSQTNSKNNIKILKIDKIDKNKLQNQKILKKPKLIF